MLLKLLIAGMIYIGIKVVSTNNYEQLRTYLLNTI